MHKCIQCEGSEVSKGDLAGRERSKSLVLTESELCYKDAAPRIPSPVKKQPLYTVGLQLFSYARAFHVLSG